MFSIQGTAKLAKVRRCSAVTPSMAIVVDLYAEGSLNLESATVYMSLETARLLGQSLLLTVAEVDAEDKAIAQGDGDDGEFEPPRCICYEPHHPDSNPICPVHGGRT